MSAPFQQYLSKIASRMRHDLKGGLLTLKMGVESLDDEETLKPLLLEKAEELVQLSDKLVLLLRMGETKRTWIGVGGLSRHILSQVNEKFGGLEIELRLEGDEQRWFVDPDALTYAVLELVQNSLRAGAGRLVLSLGMDDSGRGLVGLQDDGQGLREAGDEELTRLRDFGQSGWGRTGLGLSIVEGCALSHQGELVWHPQSDSGLLVQLALSVSEEG